MLHKTITRSSFDSIHLGKILMLWRCWNTPERGQPIMSRSTMDSVFDTELFRLGNLCRRGHDWNGSGQSLRRIKGSTCEECNRQRKRQHYTNNREQYLTRVSERYRKKRESILKYAREYREKNLESIRQRNRNYRLANLGKIRQQNREYQKVNREKRNDYQRCYRQTEKGYQVKNAASRKHKAAKRNNHNASYTSAQILELHSQFGCCAYCGVESNRLTTDHFISLASGGPDCMGNLLPACYSCNSSKQDSDPLEWYKRQPFYSNVRWEKILKALGKSGDYHQLALF